MKRLFTIVLFFLALYTSLAQERDRILTIKNNLELLAADNPAYNETLQLEVNVANVTLPNFLMAVSRVHKLNLSVAPDVANINIVNNFSNVTVADLLIFLCKEYDLTIDFTGSILAVKRYDRPPEKPTEKEIKVEFSPTTNLISLDINNDPLEKVFRKIMEVSGQNLLYSNNLRNKSLNIFLNAVPLDKAMEKIADLNGLIHSKSRDGFYLFSAPDVEKNGGNSLRGFRPGMHYEVLDTINKIVNVAFNDSPIANIIESLSHDLKLDVYTATPLEEAGSVTFNAKSIYFDDLLAHIFESQETGAPVMAAENIQNNGRARTNNNPSPSPVRAIKHFTFKKENNIYFFGTADQLSLRKIEIVQMMHRSVELLSDPSYYSGGMRTAGRTNQGGINYFANGPNSGLQGGQQGLNSSRRTLNTRANQFDSYHDGAEALVNILPDEIKADLDIKVDFELNSFFVSGPSAKIERFKSFIKEIDRPVPVVLIEVMIIEVRRSATVETGISWGIGDQPVTTSGSLFPQTDITLGANTVNKVIGGFDGFGSFNIGKVVPEFFATIKALEENGNIKIRSTPKLSTLNGHRANLSIGETTYYVITNQNFFGSQIPTTSEVRNYAPIDAELGVSIKPLVSGDGQVTLDINVIQSDFSGERIEEDAPPGLTSREFSSIIRMQNQDLAILGGLEEKIKNDSGSGVPLLARVPVIKWLFSKRKREDTKQKLTILIKPTVIY
ncbi:type II secretion system protein GspD [Allomuricauda sp. SCSIO 65647]|uniref:type II secretion system protein GspD n=1 Tax=Allomuricauda sp. SCSIO 65647 TaxID=2908843 RepID=UPI001F1AFF7C|nr:general secretion pathway protein GspD [Muricauda sp. SCSIO 65647]UJH68652.1 general secretion pathway protein GspD [Muricauda sp. SCSIO 65647]